MNQDEALRRARWQKVTDALSAHADRIKPLPDVAPLVVTFNDNLKSWDSLQAAGGGTGTGGFGDHKDAAKKAAAELLSRAGRRCSVQAHNLGLFSVEHIIDRRAYELTRLKDADARKEMDAMRAALNDHLSDFAGQGLTAGKMADIDAAIRQYVDLMPKAGEARDARVGFNAQADRLTATLDAEMGTIVHLLEAEYEDSDPGFVTTLLAAAELGRSTGHRHTGLQGTVKRKDGSPLAGYKVACAELHKEAVTDLAGAYSIPSMRNGLHLYELLDGTGKKVDEAVLKMRNGTTVIKDWVVG